MRIYAQIGAAIACVLASSPAPQAAPDPSQSCTKPFLVSEQSFRRLDTRARHAYVWIDRIETRLFRGYRPFEMFVLVGRTFAPFQAPSGRLDQKSFARIAKAAYNTDQFGPFRVTSDAVDGQRADFAFTSAKQRFSVKVVSVHTGSRAAANLQLCW